ncbi:hypothetical protein R5R35_011479 [Gryllus longicercus]|uniref:Uncharacterized protein n=2 Tax=Gryllus longicercus TaxID=2509291 RepID=A0AAN9VG84_9ORTH
MLSMLCSQKLTYQRGLHRLFRFSVALYSKRSDSELADPYKVVKAKKSVNNGEDNLLSIPPNWELLTPYGYRFFLPGSVGPAWYDATSIAQLGTISFPLGEDSDEKVTKEINGHFKFSTQDCPVLLRKGVTELFNGLDFTDSALTIISLSCKTCPDTREDPGNEGMVKTFVLAAQEICARLRMAGYWADFINPFSGRPCISPAPTMPLYETDPRFRCLDFQVIQQAGCKVIGLGKKHKFIGSLFTTAPTDAAILNKVFSKYE